MTAVAVIVMVCVVMVIAGILVGLSLSSAPLPTTSRASPVSIPKPPPLLVERIEAILVDPLPEQAAIDIPLIVRGQPIWIEPIPVILVEPAKEAVFVQRGLVVEVDAPVSLGYWHDRGWAKTPNQEIYDGYYRIVDPRTKAEYQFRGKVHVIHGTIQTYLLNKPAQMARHPRNGCFGRTYSRPGWEAGDWYLVNWTARPENVDEGILKIERYLAEAFGFAEMR